MQPKRAPTSLTDIDSMASLLTVLKRANNYSPRNALAWGFTPEGEAIGRVEPDFARQLVALEPAFGRNPRNPRRLVLRAGSSPAASSPSMRAP